MAPSRVIDLKELLFLTFDDDMAALRSTEVTKRKATNAEQKSQAFFLGIAALLREGIFNFGELLAPPVLESLKDQEVGLLTQFFHS
ncbi:hypothetical protein DAPPUDRAFT_327675 [Daphnia pulex]|uniref:PSD13 N-terminal domain-containing protein n=1 Tax=Daphnia pulex TaxID=6669 RepID=E9HBD9_DAPPU|nr:hypothetical protein DAPPUDRAFT_327675 [Daphnia pulex]|eukprot:EFX70961.1 hypothetical protein DAPPUDRAFT_327675 [Daphnia pulex]